MASFRIGPAERGPRAQTGPWRSGSRPNPPGRLALPTATSEARTGAGGAGWKIASIGVSPSPLSRSLFGGGWKVLSKVLSQQRPVGGAGIGEMAGAFSRDRIVLRPPSPGFRWLHANAVRGDSAPGRLTSLRRTSWRRASSDRRLNSKFGGDVLARLLVPAANRIETPEIRIAAAGRKSLAA